MNPYAYNEKIIHVGTPNVFHRLAPGFPLRTRCGLDAEDSRATSHGLREYQPCVVCWPSTETAEESGMAQELRALSRRDFIAELRRLATVEAERDRLREALEEACDWLDADLADTGVSAEVRQADCELIARWRSLLTSGPTEETDK